MNRYQKLTLLIAGVNIVLVFLFPPYDYVAITRGNVPTFEGFNFVFGNHPNRVINTSFLYLEILVVLVNTAIALLLVTERKAGGGRHRINYQRAMLLMVGVNLLLILLFPPFENYRAVTKAVLPTFEGFYFVFGDNRDRTIVTPILYLEVIFMLINGALFWLMFRERKAEADLTPEQAMALASALQKEAERQLKK